MTRWKKKSTEVLKESERLRKLGQPRSLDTEIEGEDGEITTLADMMPASPDLEEAIPQFMEIYEKLDLEDAELIKEHFIEGKSIDEVAIERGWNYDRAQKRLWRLRKQIEEILTQMDD